MNLLNKIQTGIYTIAEMSANHAGSYENALEIARAAKKGKPMIVSTCMGSIGEIEDAVNSWRVNIVERSLSMVIRIERLSL